MVQKKVPETAEEFLKTSKFFTLFSCNKKEVSKKDPSPRMIGQKELLVLLKGKNLSKEYGNVYPSQIPSKARG